MYPNAIKFIKFEWWINGIKINMIHNVFSSLINLKNNDNAFDTYEYKNE